MTRISLFFVMLFAFSAADAAAFKLTSDTVKNGGKIGMEHVFNSFGCEGKNMSPALKWTGAPKGTKAFAVTMYDPDAPTGSGWWHWQVVNIPADVTELAANASGDGKLPKGSLETRTDFGKPGYGGPCPPPGRPHRYVFTVYALKDMIKDLDKDASGAMTGYYLNANKLGMAKLTAKFGR